MKVSKSSKEVSTKIGESPPGLIPQDSPGFTQKNFTNMSKIKSV